MRRSVIALLAVSAMVLAGCSTGSSSAPPDVIVNTGDTQTGVSVSGTGEVTGTPDTLEVSIGVSIRADTVAEANALAAEKADAVISSLKSSGVAEEDMTTINYSIWPEYDYRGDTQTLLGYRVDNTVRAKIRDIDQAGDVLDEAVAAGGDEVTVSGLNFSIEDDEELVKAAREVAWNDAQSKAEQLAELSGQTLGKATSIVETVSRAPVPVAFDSVGGAAEQAVSTPIEPGTASVTITIQVQFALES
ncbi:MAG: SIMPL domain-containing protein [Acidimicrobiia bacterium]